MRIEFLILNENLPLIPEVVPLRLLFTMIWTNARGSLVLSSIICPLITFDWAQEDPMVRIKIIRARIYVSNLQGSRMEHVIIQLLDKSNKLQQMLQFCD